MSKINDGGPAFSAMGVGPAGDVYHESGMSFRDWIAGQVLPSVVALIGIPEDEPDDLWNACLASHAYSLADAMLKARECSAS